jgi:hypothetical protein
MSRRPSSAMRRRRPLNPLKRPNLGDLGSQAGVSTDATPKLPLKRKLNRSRIISRSCTLSHSGRASASTLLSRTG